MASLRQAQKADGTWALPFSTIKEVVLHYEGRRAKIVDCFLDGSRDVIIRFEDEPENDYCVTLDIKSGGKKWMFTNK